MDGTDLPQITIFPVRPEASWVTGAPKCRKLGDDGQPLKARFDANDSGGINTPRPAIIFSLPASMRSGDHPASSNE